MRKVLLWRLAITRGVLYCAWVCVSAFIILTEPHKAFPEMSQWEHLVVFMKVFETGVPVILAFLDKTASRLADGGPPDIAQGHTEILTKATLKTAAVGVAAIVAIAFII